MSTAIATTVPLCHVDEIAAGLGRPFLVGDRVIAVFRSRAGKVFAVDDRCPHRGGPLSDGMVVGEQVVCPLHAYRFDGANGACDQAGTCGVAAHAVEVRDGVVHLALTPR